MDQHLTLRLGVSDFRSGKTGSHLIQIYLRGKYDVVDRTSIGGQEDPRVSGVAERVLGRNKDLQNESVGREEPVLSN